MITLENLSFEKSGKQLVQDVSANFEKGKMHLILGPNGAGKSTLIKLISGELKPSNGTVLMDEKNLHHISIKEQAKIRAVLSQNIELSFPLDVSQVVLMGRFPHYEGSPNSLDMRICEESMKLFRVDEMRDRNYLTLSGGEKQRVQFARVFAQIWQPVQGKSRLLLLDEPLTFLDVFYQYDLMDKIREFMVENPDLTVLGVVHDLNIAAKYSDTIMLLKNSKVFAKGASDDVLNEKNIYEVFGVVVENKFEIK
ncbi:iron complex transport system ATP-binding protein [Algoriphagus iocasae]|uniref:Iron complex transport system ATP-binding protein n=1 Tax=Algoriphagus iocasae TaxID=1836499 RepID=A0A841N0D0_9BACT|nr:heme ABC transporter ATP-binding protein [Algoriphagus iocasae]MBB6328368.1 iron complex transport system ATP-binding protein [Algoriphagus iocasae]